MQITLSNRKNSSLRVDGEIIVADIGKNDMTDFLSNSEVQENHY